MKAFSSNGKFFFCLLTRKRQINKFSVARKEEKKEKKRKGKEQTEKAKKKPQIYQS